MTVPPGAITAAAKAILPWWLDGDSTAMVSAALEAAAPLLRAEGAAAERDRIRRLAASRHAWVTDGCTDPECQTCSARPITGLFADLLTEGKTP